ncbi:DUF4157 domain-containing protein [Streptomyces sp. NPDC046985]|uniref:eCIS core domain-containing protein n=1 Tax=Streptomyces sp. NPDC046985 TaxID=3155377 RepID=UPI003400605F
MASREETDRKPNVRRPPAQAGAAAHPAGLLALQRSVGNAAVSAWLQHSGAARSPQADRDDHRHSSGCGHTDLDVTTEAPRSGTRSLGPRPSTSTGRGAFGPAGITALQRSVGNAAVNLLVSRRFAGASARADEETEEHDHSAAPHGGKPLTVHHVLRSAGKPMDAELREEMEQRFGDGADFSPVRFHTGREAAQSAEELQAQAYTVDNHVVFNAGFERDKKIIAHELAHVEENEKGRSFKSVAYGDVNVSEAKGPSEVAADATADRVMRSPVPSATSAGAHGPSVSRKKTQGGGSSLPSDTSKVQRALKVGERDFTAEYHNQIAAVPPLPQHHQQILSRLTNEVTYAFNTEAAVNFTENERRAFTNEAAKIKWQLAKAIVAPVGVKNTYHPVLDGVVGKHPDFGAKNHDIQVNNYTELARNLMGWVYAKGRRKEEKGAAQAMHEDENLNSFLNVFLKRMFAYTKAVQTNRMMDDHDIAVMKNELRSGLAHVERRPVGAYIAHFDGAMNPQFRGTRLDARIMARGGLYEVMKHPERFNLREKMITLHDLSEYFGHSRHTPPTKGKEAVPEIDELDSLSTTRVDHRGRRIASTTDRGQNPLLHPDGAPKLDDRGREKTHPSTRNENSDTTILARSRNMPVWAGQSFTAARMFKMARASGATQEEIAALGWGIFAFWRIDFDHTTTFAYHTLHEVMDIAQNFGVKYNIDNPYHSYSKLNVSHIIGKLTGLWNQVSGLHGQADHYARGMDRARRDRSRMWTDRDDRLLAECIRISEDADRLQHKIRQNGTSLSEWEGLSEEKRTTLLGRTVENLKDWQSDIGSIQRKLERLSR